MDESTKRKYSYLVATFPIVIACVQILLGSAPLFMLVVGVGLAVAAFMLFRILSGVRIFRAGEVRFGQATTFRVWQTPVFWIPVVVTVALVVFVWIAM